MTHFHFDASWNQVKGKLRQKYSQLTDDDLNFVEGKGEELLGRLEEKLGLNEEQLEALLGDLKDGSAEAGGKVRRKIDSIKNAAGHLAEDLKGKAGHVVDDWKTAASAKVDDLKGQAGEACDQARARAQSWHGEAEEYVRRKPREALLTAVAAGFIAGLLLRR